MNGLAGKYEGMDRYECRKAWVKDLDEAGYLDEDRGKSHPGRGMLQMSGLSLSRCFRISGS